MYVVLQIFVLILLSFVHSYEFQFRIDIIIQFLMSFQTLKELRSAVQFHENYQHEIKGKRIKKQLQNLGEYRNNLITFKRYELSSQGIIFTVETQYNHKYYTFQILIDQEYPFNRPQIFYINQNSSFGQGQDLLDNVLEKKQWGPSLLINSVLDRLPDIAKKINEEPDKIKTVYHINYFYTKKFQEKFRIQKFNIEEYEWKYMIKSTLKKTLALTKQYVLIFVEEQGKDKLQKLFKIKDIKEVNASLNKKKFSIDLTIIRELQKIKLYIGGEDVDMEKILYYMNPIQAIERKVTKSQKENHTNDEIQQLISNYSQLVEFYSLRDQEKMKSYVNKIQKLVKISYENEIKRQIKLQQKIQDDIKT